MLSADVTLTLKTTDRTLLALSRHSALSSSLREISPSRHRERVSTALPTSTRPAWAVLLEASLQTSPGKDSLYPLPTARRLSPRRDAQATLPDSNAARLHKEQSDRDRSRLPRGVAPGPDKTASCRAGAGVVPTLVRSFHCVPGQVAIRS